MHNSINKAKNKSELLIFNFISVVKIMTLINLFDAYFLILIFYVSSVLIFWDYKVFLYYGDPNCANAARHTGVILMIISVFLFTLRIIVYLLRK